MLNNRDIIIFGDDWGRYPSTIQHIGRVLAKNNRVIWVGSLGLRKPEFNLGDFKRVFQKLLSVFRKNSSGVDNTDDVVVLHPFVIPLHDFKFVNLINKYLLIRKLKKAMVCYNLSNPVLLTSSPVVFNIVGRLGESSVHYICLDDYSHFKGAFSKISKFEQILIRYADSCFSVSDVLANKINKIKGKSYHLPQGVELDHFSKQSRQVPDILKDIGKPVIGYFGILAPIWINLNLLINAAKRYPEYQFLIIGRSEMDTSELNTVNNIKFIGEVPYKELPVYAQVFDVGIIPFEINDLTKACNPIKLYEYLALGIPVVSTALSEVKKFNDLVFIAENEEDFIKLIKSAVEDCTPSRNQARKLKAIDFTWEAITEKISDVIINVENNKISKRFSI